MLVPKEIPERQWTSVSWELDQATPRYGLKELQCIKVAVKPWSWCFFCFLVVRHSQFKQALQQVLHQVLHFRDSNRLRWSQFSSVCLKVPSPPVLFQAVPPLVPWASPAPQARPALVVQSSHSSHRCPACRLHRRRGSRGQSCWVGGEIAKGLL